MKELPFFFFKFHTELFAVSETLNASSSTSAGMCVRAFGEAFYRAVQCFSADELAKCWCIFFFFVYYALCPPASQLRGCVHGNWVRQL